MTILAMLASAPAAAKIRPGSLDRSFGVDGRVIEPLSQPLEGFHEFQIAPAPDGGVYVLAWRTLLRYGSNGDLDQSFGNGGQLIIGQSEGSQFEPSSLAVDSQGRVLIGGTTTPLPIEGMPGPNDVFYDEGPAPQLATVYRFTPDGQPDSSFGTGGVFTSTLGLPPPEYFSAPVNPGGVFTYEAPTVQLTGLDVNSDDEVVVTGTAVTTIGYSRDAVDDQFHEAYVALLTASGQLEPTFNGTGVWADSREFSTKDPIFNPKIGSVVYLREVGNEGTHPPGATWGLAGLGLEGEPPSQAFGPDEVEVTGEDEELAKFPEADSLAVDRFGRILLLRRRYLGTNVPKVQVARLRPGGKPDRSYGWKGSATLPYGGNPNLDALVVDSHGRVLIAGTQVAGPENRQSFALLRLRSNGKVDRSFGRKGLAVTGFGSLDANGFRVGVDEHGRIFVGGWLEPKGHPQTGIETGFALARYMP